MKTTATAWSAAQIRVMEAKDQLIAAIRAAHDAGADNTDILRWIHDPAERLGTIVADQLAEGVLEGPVLTAELPEEEAPTLVKKWVGCGVPPRPAVER